MTINKGLFTSSSSEWSTPQFFFDALDREFGFTLDPSATAENAKCALFYTQEQDGLKQKWEGVVFMNPPYGRGIGRWIEKAYITGCSGSVVVCLIPSRTDTRWWHDYVMKAQDIRFIKGRLKFGDSKNSAPFPSAVVIFGNITKR